MFCALRRIVGIKSPVLVQLSRRLKTQQKYNFILLTRTPSVGALENVFHTFKRYLASGYPNHVLVKLPALSPTMEVGTVASWNKQEGDEIKEGDVIAEIETDKATIGVEADDPGYLAKILVPAGTVGVKVGTPIAIIVEKKEDVAKFKDFKVGKESEGAALPAPPPPAQPSKPDQKGPSTPSNKPEPPARKKAIDFGKGKEAKGPEQPANKTGDKPATGKSADSAKYTDHPVSNIRSIIAKRLLQSKQEIPHFYLCMEIDTTQMEAMRKVLNSELAKSGFKISVNDIIIKAVALACRKVPETNSSWMGTHIRNYNTVDISVAVSTPTGLITPIIFNADVKVLRDISNEMKDLAKRARQGKLKPQEFQGGTFSLSNLGMMGVNTFFAIINPPQSCILAVGTSLERLYLKDSNITSVGVKRVLNVTLSCDHRVVDGAVGAQWLQEFKKLMEDPKTMF